MVLAALAAVALEPPADAAYYAAWSRVPALGYLDHPGLVAWLLSPFADAALRPALSLLPWLLALLDGLLIAALLRALGGRPHELWMLLLAPVFLGSALLWTPDAPLLLGWHLGLWAALRGRWSWLVVAAMWMTAAKIVGLYLAVLWLVALWPRPRARAWALLAVLASALTFVATGLPSLAFQLARSASVPWQPAQLLAPVALALMMLGLAGPGAAPLFIAGVQRILGRSTALTTPGDARRLLAVCAVGAALPFLLGALVTRVEANWLAPALLPVVLAGLGVPLRRPWRVAQALLAAALVALAWTAPFSPCPLRPLRGWSTWASALPAQVDAVLAERYQWHAQFALYRGVPGASFEVIESGAAIRPDALDVHRHALQPKRVLLLWAEKAPPARARQLWPLCCARGVVLMPVSTGPAAVTYYERRATQPAECNDARRP